MEALKKLPNLHNDIKHPLLFSSNDWIVPINIDLLPDDYFLFVKASEAFDSNENYTFSGSGSRSLIFESLTGFDAGDDLIVFIGNGTAKSFSFNQFNRVLNNDVSNGFLNIPYGDPLSFNDSSDLYYYLSGSLMDNKSNSFLIENSIRTKSNNFNLTVVDCLILKGFLICLVSDITTGDYYFYQFNLSNLDNPSLVVLTGFSLGNSSNYDPYVYSDGEYIYITNGGNNSANDFDFYKLDYSDNELVFLNSFSINSNFKKTTNAFIINGLIYTLFNGQVYAYDFLNNGRAFVKNSQGNNGVLFVFDSILYFSNNSSAVEWVL